MLHIRVECGIFLIGPNRSTNQRSGMTLEVQIQIFSVRACQSFHLQKFQGAQILIFVDQHWHIASFYIKEQTQKYKFEIWLLKVPFWTPKKVHFWFLKKIPEIFCSSCFAFDSALKTIKAEMFFWSVFLKMHKKCYWLSKTPFWLFLAINNAFLWVFKNTDQNNICVSIVLEAKTEKKFREKKLVDPLKRAFLSS